MNEIHFEEFEDRRHQTAYYDEDCMCYRVVDPSHVEEIEDFFIGCKGYLKKALLFTGSIAVSFLAQRILLSAAYAVDFTKINEFIPEKIVDTVLFDEKNFIPSYKTFDYRPKNRIKGREIKHLLKEVTLKNTSIQLQPQIMNYILSEVGSHTPVSSKVVLKSYPSIEQMIFQTNHAVKGSIINQSIPVILDTIPRIGLVDRLVQFSGGAIPFFGALDALGLGGKIFGAIKEQLNTNKEKKRVGLGLSEIGKGVNFGLQGLKLSSPIMILLVVYNLLRTDRMSFNTPRNPMELIIPQRKNGVQLVFGKISSKPAKYTFLFMVVLLIVANRKVLYRALLNAERIDHINSLVKQAFETINTQQENIGRLYKESLTTASGWSKDFYKNNMDTVKRDLAGSAAKDVVIQKQTQTISNLQNEKHQLLLHLNDASHIIGNCNKEFYNFREQPEIAEVIGKSANNRFSLDNPEYIYREVNYGEKKKTISIINEMQSMIGGGSITDYLREPNYFFL